MSFSYELITPPLPPRTLYEHIGTTHVIWCLEFNFLASNSEESVSDAMERLDKDEAAEKDITGSHTPLLSQKAMVTLASVGGWDAVGPLKYPRVVKDRSSSGKASEEEDESESSDEEDEGSDFEAQKAQNGQNGPSVP